MGTIDFDGDGIGRALSAARADDPLRVDDFKAGFADSGIRVFYQAHRSSYWRKK
jgi:hypothetical protein